VSHVRTAGGRATRLASGFGRLVQGVYYTVDMSLPRCVVWEPLEEGLQGHDLVVLSTDNRGWFSAHGTVAAVQDGVPWGVHYELSVDTRWRTRFASVTALDASGRRTVLLDLDGEGRVVVNAKALPDLAGCLDVDLAATPFTNTLAIRRMRLEVGQSAVARAVWVGAPHLELEVLEQTYTRIGVDRYRYEVPASGFSAELTVDDEGLVVDYSGLARRVASSG
jgi:uncharacterized protein